MAEGEKTEKATPKRRRDAREKGDVPKSQDITTMATLLGGFYALKFFVSGYIEGSRDFLLLCIREIETLQDLTNEEAGRVLVSLALEAGRAILPVLLILMGIGILSVGIQTKFLFAKKSLGFKLSHLNPISGIKNMFSLKNLINLLKNMIKISILLVILYQYLNAHIPGLIQTMHLPTQSSMKYLWDTVMTLVIRICMWFTAIAAFDYAYERWEHERKLKMSKQEVKEEFKQTEGDPQVKGKIRSIQRQRALSRMMQAVPKADVVIRNPTHFAVALKYDINHDNAPVLLAKGQDELALRIVSLAEENNVAIVENKQVARAIYSSTELNQEIPPQLYGIVAEILVYVYKLRDKEGNK